MGLGGAAYDKDVRAITLIGFALDSRAIGENPLPVFINDKAAGVAKSGDRLGDCLSGEAGQIGHVLMGEPHLDAGSSRVNCSMLICQREQNPGHALIGSAELHPLHLVQDMIQPAVGNREHVQGQCLVRLKNLEKWLPGEQKGPAWLQGNNRRRLVMTVEERKFSEPLARLEQHNADFFSFSIC